MPSNTMQHPPVPLIFRLVFTTLEPFTALLGWYHAHFQQKRYLSLTVHMPYNSEPDLGCAVALRQLANMYLLFAINEALVLRATNDRRVWAALLFGFLIADVGHLWSLRILGLDYLYYTVSEWNPMDVGNIGIVYAGMTMRILFFVHLAIGKGSKVPEKME